MPPETADLTDAADPLAAAIRAAMDEAAISGLCREGQIEIGAQAARRLRPGLTDAERQALAEAVYERARSDG